jgi:hypothetical protein
MGTTPLLAAALAGIPAGIQRQGLWAGRRQLFIRFAGPAETAQMYTADALARELNRALGRAPFHSVSVSGRDALGNAEFLAAALRQLPSSMLVMADTDGQRPEAMATLHEYLHLVQITVDAPAATVAMERVQDMLRQCVATRRPHALIIAGTDEASDADYLQIVEQANAASPETAVVIHPGPTPERNPLDRRWSVLLEHAMAKHGDVRIALRMAGPGTMR